MDAPREYANLSWSLLDLAKYQIQNRVILNDLEAQQHELNFPATIAIWAVGHAQSSEEGGKLWDLLDNYSQAEKSKIAKKFTQSMDLLNFDLFSDELFAAQRHSQLASIHAMIPDFAVPKFGQVIVQGVRLNRPKDQILDEILQDTTISKGVARLFSARQEMALDIIERVYNFLAYGYDIDLPDRILNKIGSQRVRNYSTSAPVKFPTIRFYESDRHPTILNSTGWTFSSASGEILDPIRFPPVQIFAQQAESEKLMIFDPKSSYLVFSDDGKIQRTKRLPEVAGFLLWSSETRLLTDSSEMDIGYLIGPGWETWNYAYFQHIDRIDLITPDEQLTTLLKSEKSKITTKVAPHLSDANGSPVFTSYPVISSGQQLKVTDNLKNIKFRTDGSITHLGAEPDHLIDFTLSGGLGKSSRVRGLVIPGMKIEGLDQALIQGEKRELRLELPEYWHFEYPQELKNKTKGSFSIDADVDLEKIDIVDQNGILYTLYLDIPVLSWSLILNDRESQMTGTETKLLLEDRSHIESLIIHNVTDYVPVLNVAGSIKVGKKRGTDLLFDLRSIQQDRSISESVISITWNYQILNLLSFRKLSRRKPISLHSLRDLTYSVAMEAELFTEADFADYQRLKEEESIQYRNRLRELRGRY